MQAFVILDSVDTEQRGVAMKQTYGQVKNGRGGASVYFGHMCVYQIFRFCQYLNDEFGFMNSRAA